MLAFYSWVVSKVVKFDNLGGDKIVLVNLIAKKVGLGHKLSNLTTLETTQAWWVNKLGCGILILVQKLKCQNLDMMFRVCHVITSAYAWFSRNFLGCLNIFSQFWHACCAFCDQAVH